VQEKVHHGIFLPTARGGSMIPFMILFVVFIALVVVPDA